jgi:hypothetical protein
MAGCEAGVGGVKPGARYEAARRDRPGEWTCDDAYAAGLLANIDPDRWGQAAVNGVAIGRACAASGFLRVGREGVSLPISSQKPANISWGVQGNSAMKMATTAVLSLLTIFMSGCDGSRSISIVDIGIINRSPDTLFVSVESGTLSQSFGVVVPGGTAVKAGGPVGIGKPLSVVWSVGHPSNEKKTESCQVDPNAISVNTVQLRIVRTREEGWELEVQDKAGRVVRRVPFQPPAKR